MILKLLNEDNFLFSSANFACFYIFRCSQFLSIFSFPTRERLSNVLAFTPYIGGCSASSFGYLLSLPIWNCAANDNSDNDNDDYSSSANNDCLGSYWNVTNLKKFFINPFSLRYIISIPIFQYFFLIFFFIVTSRIIFEWYSTIIICFINNLFVIIEVKVITWFCSKYVAFPWLHANIVLFGLVFWDSCLTPGSHSDLTWITCNILVILQWSKVNEKIVFSRNVIFITKFYFVYCGYFVIFISNIEIIELFMFLNNEINLFIETILLNLNENVSIFVLFWILNKVSSRSNYILAMPIIGFLSGNLSIPHKFSLINLEKAFIDCNENILVFWTHACILWRTGKWSYDSILNFIFFNAKLIVTLSFTDTGFLVVR